MVRLIDLTNDAKLEELVDAPKLSYSSVLSLWGGTVGTYLRVIVDSQVHEFFGFSMGGDQVC